MTYLQVRKYKFYLFSDKKLLLRGRCQPILANGQGIIDIHRSVEIGNERGYKFYSTYAYVEARNQEDRVEIHEGTLISNNANIVACGANIIIGKRCLIGADASIISSDFHDLNPLRRHKPKIIHSCDVVLEDNVFLGNNVSITKGVVIGENSVVAAGSVVNRSVPKNVIVAGNPAVVVREL